MSWLGDLRATGILGLNRRNSQYTLAWNDRRLYPRVDNKLQTKALCAEARIPTARMLGAAEFHGELRAFLGELSARDSFVVKPAHGAMGNGVLVVVDRDGDQFRRASGAWIDARGLHYHAASIISGAYALGGQRDIAFAEERLEVHPSLAPIAVDGVPDIRIVVYRGVPVMAMTRLPTRASRGRANLHQGAIGAGIDLATGRTNWAVQGSRPVTRHPDTDEPVVGHTLPEFERAVDIAVRAADATELGYVGADVVVDAHRGALILELNARPGLAIQIANRAGLRPRLQRVDGCARDAWSVADRIAFGGALGAGNTP